jgi:signal transduction histidine kinase
LDIANAALLLAGVVLVLYAAQRPLRWSHGIQVVALVLMAALLLQELARYLGWIDVESPVFRHYHVPVMLVAIGIAVFERHVLATWRVDQLNVELERRVADKAREIEANHARIEEAIREQALARERQRIVTDMHDGLGASLIGLLRHVQSGSADRASIEQRVQEALQEMRIAIDAMQPHEGDLAAVLGNLRYRLHDMIQTTGISMTWEVDELPLINELKPSTVFAIQRILLETITNALKHADARQLRVIAHTQGEACVEIRIEDNGRGFDPSQPATGLGLTNMRARAEQIGATLNIASQSGTGTVVRLTIPSVLSRPVDEPALTHPAPRALQGLVPVSGTA